MTTRKRAEAAKTATVPLADSPSAPEPSPNSSEALRSPERGLSGWFGLFVRICVYFTAALCLEVFLSAVDRWLTGERE